MISVDTVLILGKDLTTLGGVNNYYNIFLDNFEKKENKNLRIRYFTSGLRNSESSINLIKYISKHLLDILRFLNLLKMNKKIKIVKLNPSLIPIPLIRDISYLMISKFFNKKVIIFIHGWKQSFVNFLNKNVVCLWLFVKIYSHADNFIVLARGFKKILIKWGIDEKKIEVSKMMFDGTKFNLKSKLNNFDNIASLFYLGRLQNIKGILEIIHALSILKKKGYNFCMTFAGNPVDEGTLYNLKLGIKNLELEEMVYIEDYVSGEYKMKLFKKADIFIFPSYTEGCPTVVLEAMAAGLFIITTPVGALPEIIEDGVNGCFVRARDSIDLAKKIEWAIDNIEKVRELGVRNIDYAFKNFESKIIIRQIDELYKQLLVNKP